jgi:hypothetical protein
MPQRALRPPLLAGLHREATNTLAALRHEITQREHELAALKAEAARWQSVLQGPPVRRARPAVAPPPVPPAKRLRLDWSAILKELPTRFTTQEVAQKAGKPPGHVYVYMSRWMKDKKVRRVQDGYQKVSQAI